MRTRAEWILTLGISAGLLFGAFSGIALGSAHAVRPSILPSTIRTSPLAQIAGSRGTSQDVAGYMIESKTGLVSLVQASWNVPQIAAKCPKNNTYAQFWVGILSSNFANAVQLGTDTDCIAGTAHYYAWYRLFPNAPVVLSFPIAPADTMQSIINYSSTTHKYTLTIYDADTGKGFSAKKAFSQGNRTWAAWIAGARYAGHVDLLTDFGWVFFQYGYATIAGTTHAIGGFSNWVEITMLNSSRSVKMAIPLALRLSGEDFRVNWHSAGP